jgi:phospholipid transport system substrate-binding protein
MGKRSLGAHWRRRTSEEQKQFIESFSELVEASYVDAIESYDGEKVVIGGDKQDKEFAEVNTKILTKKGEEFAIGYRLHQSGGAWKVYDVVLENVSLVNNYRSQFNRVIAKSSYDELLSKLKQKQFDAPGKKQKT